MEEARKVASMAIEQGEEQKGGHSRSTKRKNKKVHFAALMDIRHLKKAELETKVPIVHDHGGQKSYDETRVLDPQSCVGWCLTESSWTHKSKSNMLAPTTQLADILTKGQFHT